MVVINSTLRSKFLKEISDLTLLEVSAMLRRDVKLEDTPQYRTWYASYKERIAKEAINNMPVSAEVGNEDMSDIDDLYSDLFEEPEVHNRPVAAQLAAKEIHHYFNDRPEAVVGKL